MFTLPPLPFSIDALEPDVSAETLREHHDAHHADYVEKLNGLVDGTPLADLPLDDLVGRTRDDASHAKVFNNAAQHWNHSFFWRNIAPGGNSGPGPELASLIQGKFGSFGEFRARFIKSGTEQFGSGWLWLVRDGDGIAIVTTHDADTPCGTGKTALLCCDLWEHAYYLDYQHRRPEFLAAFIDRLANWKFAELRLSGTPAEADMAGAASQHAPDPRVRFRSPELLVAQEGMEDAEKVALLEQWHLDLDNRLKAEEEGMSASDPMSQRQESQLADEAARVKRCLAELADATGDARHCNSPFAEE